jgi:nucleoside-diphosphate-sugar epimerase
VNLTGSLRLMRHSVRAGVKRFVFASSMSVYGSHTSKQRLTEDDPAAPDEVYGAAKRTVEVIGENLSKAVAIRFIALRIARVVGPGIRKISSPWRSQIVEASPNSEPIRISFSPYAMLSLVYVEDVARMLLILLEAAHVNHCVYDTPVEIWQAKQLKEVVENVRGVPVDLDGDAGHGGGPICDGSRFAQEFEFRAAALRDRLENLRSN